MILNKHMILANEICEHAGIYIGNFSQQSENIKDSGAIFKLAGTLFVDSSSSRVPKFAKKYINEMVTHTDLSDKLPLTYILNSLKITSKPLIKLGIIKEITTICNKRFATIDAEFLKFFKKFTFYKVTKDEFNEYKSTIEGYYKCNNNSYLIYY